MIFLFIYFFYYFILAVVVVVVAAAALKKKKKVKSIAFAYGSRYKSNSITPSSHQKKKKKSTPIRFCLNVFLVDIHTFTYVDNFTDLIF